MPLAKPGRFFLPVKFSQVAKFLPLCEQNFGRFHFKPGRFWQVSFLNWAGFVKIMSGFILNRTGPSKNFSKQGKSFWQVFIFSKPSDFSKNFWQVFIFQISLANFIAHYEVLYKILAGFIFSQKPGYKSGAILFPICAFLLHVKTEEF